MVNPVLVGDVTEKVFTPYPPVAVIVSLLPPNLSGKICVPTSFIVTPGP